MLLGSLTRFLTSEFRTIHLLLLDLGLRLMRQSRTGRILHGYGNVKQSKAELSKFKGDNATYATLMDASHDLHQAALAQLESTLGAYHHRVADLCHRMAVHMITRGEHESAQ